MSATTASSTYRFRQTKRWVGDAAPTADNDQVFGCGIGDDWTDKTNKRAFRCISAATGAAVWADLGSAIADVGTPATGTGLTVAEQGAEGYHKTTWTFASYALATADHTTSGAEASKKLYDFPEGLIRIHGVVVNLAIVASGSGPTASAAIVGALGTAAAGTNNGTLTGTEADIIPSTACTLTTGSGAFVAMNNAPIVALTDNSGGTASDTLAAITGSYVEATVENTVASLAAKINEIIAVIAPGKTFDGTATAKDLYLNFAMADAEHGAAAGVLTLTGTIQVLWSNYGDK